jgi:hypothetical protein
MMSMYLLTYSRFVTYLYGHLDQLHGRAPAAHQLPIIRPQVNSIIHHVDCLGLLDCCLLLQAGLLVRLRKSSLPNNLHCVSGFGSV